MTAVNCNQGDKGHEDYHCNSENYSECEHVIQLSTREAARRILSAKQVRLYLNFTLFQSSAFKSFQYLWLSVTEVVVRGLENLSSDERTASLSFTRSTLDSFSVSNFVAFLNAESCSSFTARIFGCSVMLFSVFIGAKGSVRS
jgi:hypothetical protein